MPCCAAVFGIVALVLAAVGLYGTMSPGESAERRDRYLLGLGADPSSIMRLVIAQGLRLFVIGAVIGMLTALAGA